MSNARYDPDLLLPLLPVVKDPPAEGILLHRVLECHTRRSSPLSEAVDVDERMLELLRDHMERRVYSPRLPILYFYWQTLQQMTTNGMSNFSTIDYALHNRVFRQCADVIIDRIRADPDHMEARVAIWTLFSMPTIERFPANYHFGNSVALHHAHLSRFFEDEGGE